MSVAVQHRWTKKPTQHTELNKGHKFAPNRLCAFLSGNPSAQINLCDGKAMTPQVIADIAGTTYAGDGEVLDFTYDAVTRSQLDIETITLSTSIPWEMTWRATRSSSSSTWWMIMGNTANTNDFMGYEIGPARFGLRNSSGATYYVSDTLATDEMATYTWTSDGGGSGASTLKLYRDGVLLGTATAAGTTSYVINSVGNCYSGTAGFSFSGLYSHARVSEGKLYSAEDVAELHENLYQVLKPRLYLVGAAAVGGAAITGQPSVVRPSGTGYQITGTGFGTTFATATLVMNGTTSVSATITAVTDTIVTFSMPATPASLFDATGFTFTFIADDASTDDSAVVPYDPPTTHDFITTTSNPAGTDADFTNGYSGTAPVLGDQVVYEKTTPEDSLAIVVAVDYSFTLGSPLTQNNTSDYYVIQADGTVGATDTQTVLFSSGAGTLIPGGIGISKIMKKRRLH